jgi:hypothetical protein
MPVCAMCENATGSYRGLFVVPQVYLHSAQVSLRLRLACSLLHTAQCTSTDSISHLAQVSGVGGCTATGIGPSAAGHSHKCSTLSHHTPDTNDLTPGRLISNSCEVWPYLARRFSWREEGASQQNVNHLVVNLGSPRLEG